MRSLLKKLTSILSMVIPSLSTNHFIVRLFLPPPYKNEIIIEKAESNLEKINRTGRYIFGQEEEQGKNSVVSLFSVILHHTDTNNVSLVTDFVYMGRYAPLIKNTLSVSFSLKKSNETLKPVLHLTSRIANYKCISYK